MAEIVDFFYDVGSPESYLVQSRIEEACRRSGSVLAWRATLARDVRARAGTPEPSPDSALLAARAEALGLPFAPNPHAPLDTSRAMRVIVAAQERGLHMNLLRRLFRAAWAEGADLGDDAVLIALSDEARVPGRPYLQRSRAGHVDQRLGANAQEAVSRGAADLPAVGVGDRLWTGLAALDALEALR